MLSSTFKRRNSQLIANDRCPLALERDEMKGDLSKEESPAIIETTFGGQFFDYIFELRTS